MEFFNLQIVLKNISKITALAYQKISYQWLLPLMSHLPVFFGEKFSWLRGLVNGILDLEWRSIAMNSKFVKTGTYHALDKIVPQSSPLKKRFLTYQRFISFSREELDAAMFPHRNIKQLFDKSHIYNFASWQQTIQSGTGLVVLCCHYDCFTMGMVMLGMKGIKVNAMSSSIDDPRVSEEVKNFYDKKYRGMEKYFNGGQIIDIEDNLRFFYNALHNNEIVFILADLPATGKDASPQIIAPFIDNHYHMAPGPFRLAQKTHSKMAAFYCLNQGSGQYHIYCSDVYDIKDISHTVSQLYTFLQQPIKKYPGRWWTSELMNHYIS